MPLSNDEKRQQIVDYLNKNNIQLSIGGCGCCESPWVAVKIEDGTILETDSVSIDTLKE